MTITEEEWNRTRRIRSLLSASRLHTPSRQRWLFIAACCRLVEQWFYDQRCRTALEWIESLAEGRAIPEDYRKYHRGALRAAEAFRVPPSFVMVEATREQASLWGIVDAVSICFGDPGSPERKQVRQAIAACILDISGNPFREIRFDPTWRTSTTTAIALQMYESRDFAAMPILADALQDAGCEDEAILEHCRKRKRIHTRGCWVVEQLRPSPTSQLSR